MTAEQNAKIIESIPGLTPDLLRFHRQNWTPQNTMRQILNVVAKQAIEGIRNGLETCEPDQLYKQQGQIQGIKTMIGLINAQGDL